MNLRMDFIANHNDVIASTALHIHETKSGCLKLASNVLYPTKNGYVREYQIILKDEGTGKELMLVRHKTEYLLRFNTKQGYKLSGQEIDLRFPVSINSY